MKLKDTRISKKVPVSALAVAAHVTEAEYLVLETHPYECTFTQAKEIADCLGVGMWDIDWESGIEEANERRMALSKR